MSSITSLRLLVADLRHGKLCLLGYKFVVRQSHVRRLPKASSGLSRRHSTFFNHEFLPLLLSPKGRVDSIAIVPPRGFVQRSSF
jgi:hypothetical protein